MVNVWSKLFLIMIKFELMINLKRYNVQSILVRYKKTPQYTLCGLK